MLDKPKVSITVFDCGLEISDPNLVGEIAELMSARCFALIEDVTEARDINKWGKLVDAVEFARASSIMFKMAGVT